MSDDQIQTAPPVEETPPPPAEPDDDDDATSAELSSDETRAELERARRQAARYRTERNRERERIAALEAQIRDAATPAQPDAAVEANRRAEAAERRALLLEEAAAAGVPVQALRAFRALDAATDADAMRAALTDLRQHLSVTPAGPSRPPETPSQPRTLSEQIADAEQRGDLASAMRLKAQQLATLRQSMT